jgi:hypothetical protein
MHETEQRGRRRRLGVAGLPHVPDRRRSPLYPARGVALIDTARDRRVDEIVAAGADHRHLRPAGSPPRTGQIDRSN